MGGPEGAAPPWQAGWDVATIVQIVAHQPCLLSIMTKQREQAGGKISCGEYIVLA